MEKVVGEPWSRLRRSNHSQEGVSRGLEELEIEDTSLLCAANFTRAIAGQELFVLPTPVAIWPLSSSAPGRMDTTTIYPKGILGSLRAWLIHGTTDLHSSCVSFIVTARSSLILVEVHLMLP